MKTEKTSKREGIGCLILFFTPFVIVGLGTLLFSSYNFIKAIQTYNWVQVEATLERSKLEVESKRRTKKRKRTKTYRAHIDYTYTSGGKEYHGDMVGFGYGKNNIDRHHEVYRKLKNVKKIKVWVNPNNPSESVMTKGTNESTIGIFIFSLIWNSMISMFLIPLAMYNKNDKGNEIFAPQNKKKIRIAKHRKKIHY